MIPSVKKARVSIVTPCYNDIRYISECIESVLAQDWSDVEHVIQDGGSSDGTKELVAGYAAKFPARIRFASASDRGQADGLNKALQRATGDILLVLNADDAILPHAASWAVKHLAADPNVAVVYGDVLIMDEDSRVIEKFVADQYDFNKLLCVEIVPPAQAAFISRPHFEKVGFYADDTLDTCPDYEMWIRIGLRFPMKHVPGFVTKYRRHIRPLDSKSERTVGRFVASKKLVMDRVFNASRTPERLKKLRFRAYVGLSLWAAASEIGAGGFNTIALRFILRGLRGYHRDPVALLHIVRRYLTMYIKRCLTAI